MLSVLACLSMQGLQSAIAEDSAFVLNAVCPPSFELNEKSECIFRSLYHFYGSTQDTGVGGTHTGLPRFRDGFSPKEIDLGRYLFFDPLLSKGRDLSCASCHQPRLAFTDGRAVSLGHQDKRGTRSAPSLWNLGFLDRLFWDARAESLEQQALGPLYSEIEMANDPQSLLEALDSDQNYPAMFEQAFPESSQISLNQVYRALAAFQASLVSLNSRYDRYAHGDQHALSAQEIKGLNVFRSFVARCSECHTPPLFTNKQIAVIGTPEPKGKEFDVGAESTFSAPKLRGGFKVPSLRNIALTAPYMHSGRFENLVEAARFYTLGRGHAVPEDQDLLLHWHISEPDLQEHELQAIADFLHALTDQSMLPLVPEVLPSGLPLVHLNKN